MMNIKCKAFERRLWDWYVSIIKNNHDRTTGNQNQYYFAWRVHKRIPKSDFRTISPQATKNIMSLPNNQYFHYLGSLTRNTQVSARISWESGSSVWWSAVFIWNIWRRKKQGMTSFLFACLMISRSKLHRVWWRCCRARAWHRDSVLSKIVNFKKSRTWADMN